MTEENRDNLDGIMKDRYAKSVQEQTGFHKSINKCKSCGRMIKHSGGTMCSSCSGEGKEK